MTELFRVLEPMLATYLSSLPVAISLTLDGWFNRNLKGFYIVTAHWVDINNHATKSILLTILDVESGNGAGQRVGSALFEYLKRMGRDVVTRLLNVVTDNGSDAVAAVTRLFQLVNTFVGYEQMHRFNHVRCADHSVQLAVLTVLKTVKKSTKVLSEALVTIRRSKVIRQQYRIEVIAADPGSKEPTHQDSPTRWNSTHEMCTDAYSKRVVLDNIMDQFEDDIGHGALSDEEWHSINCVAAFLRLPRQIMEGLAADLRSTLHLVARSFSMLTDHCDDHNDTMMQIDEELTTVPMKQKLNKYKAKLLQEPAIMAAYLNPQLPKPTDPREYKAMINLVKTTLQKRHSTQLTATASSSQSNAPSDPPFAYVLLQFPERSGKGEEIEQYIQIGYIHASGFTNVLKW